MLQVDPLFTSPSANAPCRIMTIVFQTFAAEWGTFMTISFARAGCFIGLFIAYALLSFLLGISILNVVLSTNNDDGVADRLLGDYYDYPYDTDNLARIAAEILSMRSGFLFLNLVFCILAAYTYSSFQGSMVHAVTTTHANQTPSMKFSSDRSWKLFLYHAIVFAATILLIVLSVSIFKLTSATNTAYIIIYLLSTIIYIVVSCAMIGAIPAIVVEKTYVIHSFQRSWSLCGSFFCSILSNYICFILLEAIINECLWLLLPQSDNIYFRVLMFVLFLVTIIAFFPLATIMEVTLYLNFRVQAENLSLSQYGQQLGLVDNKSDYKLHKDNNTVGALV